MPMTVEQDPEQTLEVDSNGKICAKEKEVIINEDEP